METTGITSMLLFQLPLSVQKWVIFSCLSLFLCVIFIYNILLYYLQVLEEETPSPAEVAKSYMGSRPTKLAPSPLGLTSHNTTSLQKTSITPKTANNFKGLENGFLTPRSRGRSAMYSMARTPYTKSPLNFNQKVCICLIHLHLSNLLLSFFYWGRIFYLLT